MTDRLGHDWRYAIENEKIQSQLQWKPVYSLVSGLRITIDYFIKLLQEDLLAI